MSTKILFTKVLDKDNVITNVNKQMSVCVCVRARVEMENKPDKICSVRSDSFMGREKETKNQSNPM